MEKGYTIMDSNKLLIMDGKFTWNYNSKFHIETREGNYVYSDPNYNGDNTIRPAPPYPEWLKEENIPYGRDKGWHVIGLFCDKDVRVVLE